MELTTTFLYTFGLVLIGELGDKTQIATGTGTLANRNRTQVIFLSSALALITVAGLTVFFASLIPDRWIPYTQYFGGVLLMAYGLYLFLIAGKENESKTESSSVGWKLFLAHFSVVFMAELGDKTQFATLAVAIENQSALFLVFVASATALVTVTAITVWGVAKIPEHWTANIQRIGAILMSLFGLYMIF